MKYLICILILFGHMNLYAQTDMITVTGIVKDKEGEPLIGCSVILKGTPNGTMADIDGDYKISAPLNGILEFSYVGFKSQTIEINGKKRINVTLEENEIICSHPVYIYTKESSQSDMSTSLSWVGTQFSGRPNNEESLLQGFSRGIYYNPFSGSNIRGGSNIAGGEVLYVVDGVPNAPFNPADVRSYRITSDVASSSVFGTGIASGGVVHITTRKDYYENSPLEADTWIGLQQASVMFPRLDKKRYDEHLRTGFTQHYHIRSSHRFSRVNLNASVSYDNTENTIRSSNDSQLKAQVNGEFFLHQYAKISQQLFYNRYSERDGIIYDYNPDNSSTESSTGANIIDHKPTDRIYSATTLEVRPWNKIHLRSLLSYDYIDSSDKTLASAGYNYYSVYNPDYDYRSVYNGRSQRLMWDNTIGHSIYIYNHNINLTGGYIHTQDRLRPLSTDLSGDNRYTTGKEIINTLSAQADYNYKNGARTLTASIRHSESSKLKPDKSSANLPALSAGWDIMREDWVYSEFFYRLRPKVAWGRTGSTRAISPFGDDKDIYSNLRWIITDQRNAGIDLTLKRNNSIYITADYFYKKTYNLLEVVPSAAGVMITSGNTQLINRGWDFSASYMPINKNKISLYFQANYTRNNQAIRHTPISADNDSHPILGEYNTPQNIYNFHSKFQLHQKFYFAMLFHGASDLKTGYTYGNETKTDYYGLKMLNVSYMLKDRYNSKPQIRLYLNAENLFTKVNTDNKSGSYDPLYLLPFNRAISVGINVSL
ncbi:carboxypeptidase-like regulatory domain-containing protein [Dysgonomonas macrotermitis]|uniref:Outer membrane receptor proteins, mostly Fe transport n=1 Tax=Dysgonomonas macrotermitis TaxID=1346286 RepID=A0A1M5EMM9_9BACT|nr:carboxypeptidase-like regulatory domain-containing protein [Dysgonomonas macrotermitis]SHF80499.1 Outer membrane receptor proteins, mostly Fe transport [Dysgonomonas macrotermitis]